MLRVISKAIKRKFGLNHLATEDVTDFNTDDHVTYTDEEPNALHPDQVPLFMQRIRELYPQFYAVTFLGFATGLRPSSLRPLRRRGPEADIKWDEGRILIRRSQTKGTEVMKMTKQRTRYSINVPHPVLDVLTWQRRAAATHARAARFGSVVPKCDRRLPQSDRLEQAVRRRGGGTGVTRVYPARVATDLQRPGTVREIDRLIVKSVSGHDTVEMIEHYSSVSPEEQREGIGKVIQLFSAGGPVSVAGGPLTGPLGSSGGPLNEKTG